MGTCGNEGLGRCIFERILHVDLTWARAGSSTSTPGRFSRIWAASGWASGCCTINCRPALSRWGRRTCSSLRPAPSPARLVATGSKHAVVAKSPLTGMIGDSLSGSFWSHTLRRAGYDALVISGRAESPVYLSISDDQVRIRKAGHLMGLNTFATEDAVRRELGSDEYSVSAIGPAGERMVRFALIANDRGRMAGRTGLGAVMGSKNLKAIAVRGSKTIRIADMAALEPLAMDLARRCQGPMTEKYRGLGTASNVLVFDYLGTLPTRNYRQATFEGAEKISGEALSRRYVERVVACSGCPVACEHLAVVREGPLAGAQSRIDYEPLYAMTSLWGVDDLPAAIRAIEIAGLTGMDGVSAGTVVAWAMECFERGILSRERLRRAGAALRQRGGGPRAPGEDRRDAKGSATSWRKARKRAAEQVGHGSLDFAMQVKGMEMAGYDPRSLKTMGLGLCRGDAGALPQSLARLQRGHPGARRSLRGRPGTWPGAGGSGGQGRGFRFARRLQVHPGRVRRFSRGGRQALPRGHRPGDDAGDAGGERATRICNLKKAFNIREGWTAADDWLPPRALRDAVPSGPNHEPLVVQEHGACGR